MLPPTRPELLDDAAAPYFVWWAPMTVGQLKQVIATGAPEERAYWLGALLREANSRDVWLFTNPDQIRGEWQRLLRHLGRKRSMWAWLLGLPEPQWPPRLFDHA